MDNRLTVDALIAFYEGLSPETLQNLPRYYAADACFKDPFNEVRGLQSIERIFTHMFRQVSEPRFVVLERVVDGQGALLVWDFHYRLRLPWGPDRRELIRGSSHLRFDPEGKVVWHRDYWDAAEELYAKLPGLGWLMRALRRKLAA
ncbi:MAG: nuclear transport factor 2 family protein [Candidatus Accumulibacter sp.]|nr:nuclear transport factor 2 family protein [Accumulibacter sp.]